MNFKQLRVFYEAVRGGSFTAAAHKLGVSQPAISMQVKELEKALEVRLYHRDGRQIVLTEAGHLLMHYADRLFRLADEAARQLIAIRDRNSQTLRLSTTKTLATYFLPKVMGAFKGLHKGVSIRLDIGTNACAIEAVSSGTSDVGLVVNPTDGPQLVRTPLFEDELVLVAAPFHPMAGHRSMDKLDLTTETLIVREKGSKTREVAEAALRDRQIPVGQTMELADVEAIKSAVRTGLGLSVVTAMAVQEEVKARTLVAIRFLDGQVRLRFEAIHRRDNQSAVVRAFLANVVPPSRPRRPLALAADHEPGKSRVR